MRDYVCLLSLMFVDGLFSQCPISVAKGDCITRSFDIVIMSHKLICDGNRYADYCSCFYRFCFDVKMTSEVYYCHTNIITAMTSIIIYNY